jgi:hypothetical protein
VTTIQRLLEVGSTADAAERVTQRASYRVYGLKILSRIESREDRLNTAILVRRYAKEEGLPLVPSDAWEERRDPATLAEYARVVRKRRQRDVAYPFTRVWTLWLPYVATLGGLKAPDSF